MEPVFSSPVTGSAFWSLTSKSPVKIDHLVTFIACEIVTGRPGYENFSFAPRLQASPSNGASAGRLLPCGIPGRRCRRLRRWISRLTWLASRPARREGGHDDREMHRRI